MTGPAPIHSSFTIERDFEAPRSLVFTAWTDPVAKTQWFIGPAEWTELKRTLDPQAGGVDILHGKFTSGSETHYTARYHLVRPDDLLVYAYDMHIDGAHLSTSLATVALRARGAATKLIYTEQAVYYDGEDGGASRKAGITAHFEHLAAHLATLRGIV